MKNKYNFLICEDEPDLAELIELHLKDLFKDSNCFICKDANEGMKVIESKKINMIVSDKSMPIDGNKNVWNGLDLYCHLKNTMRSIPFLLITGTGSTKPIKLYENDENFYYLAKPYQTENLYQVVLSCIENQKIEHTVKGKA